MRCTSLATNRIASLHLIGCAFHCFQPIRKSLIIEHASIFKFNNIYLCSDFLSRNVTATQIQVPVVLPLLILHPFARSPSQGYLFPMKSELVKVL